MVIYNQSSHNPHPHTHPPTHTPTHTHTHTHTHPHTRTHTHTPTQPPHIHSNFSQFQRSLNHGTSPAPPIIRTRAQRHGATTREAPETATSELNSFLPESHQPGTTQASTTQSLPRSILKGIDPKLYPETWRANFLQGQTQTDLLPVGQRDSELCNSVSDSKTSVKQHSAPDPWTSRRASLADPRSR